MALISKKLQTEIEQNKYETHIEAQVAFKDRNQTQENRIDALEYLLANKSTAHILKIANDLFALNVVEDHIYIDLIFSGFSGKKITNEDFEQLLETLKSDNVYLRNIAIKYLQERDEDAIEFIENLLKNPDQDIRIFAINILGDVRYDKSVDILRYFIAQEVNINAMMTAVDYIGEIGSVDDIPLLESLKVTHKDNPYVLFGVDMAINRING
jgi:hypothetical protein